MSGPAPIEGRVFVAGHRGLVGSAVHRALLARGTAEVITRSRAELDLTDEAAVTRFFRRERPDRVFLCAARVGGILANSTRPAEFIRENLAIQTNVIHQAWRHSVRRLVFLGSSCIYPRDCPQPIREASLMTGPLEPTNRAYAVAKIAGLEMCDAYNRQYATEFVTLMPTNLFGPGDNYDLASSHVIAALIRKAHEAKVAHAPAIEVWGTGQPMREFLWSEDLAAAALHVAGTGPQALGAVIPDGAPPLLNVGTGKEISIAGLAALVSEEVGYGGSVRWNRARPDGTPRKVLDVSRMHALGWRPSVSLREGVARAYRAFLESPFARAAAGAAPTAPRG